VRAYQALFQSVTYNDTSTNPSSTRRTVTFTANDGALLNNIGTGSRFLDVTPVTVAPTINQIPNPATIVETPSPRSLIPLSGITPAAARATSYRHRHVDPGKRKSALISTPIQVNYFTQHHRHAHLHGEPQTRSARRRLTHRDQRRRHRQRRREYDHGIVRW